MDIEIFGDSEVAVEILELTKLWDKSVEKCDASELIEGYIDNVEIFDVGSQIVGAKNFKELWQTCFPFFGDSPQVTRRKIKLYASSNLAFMHFYSKICGSNQPKPEESPWCRTTVCFQKNGSKWSVVHEHVSMPIDFEKGSPEFIFGEP